MTDIAEIVDHVADALTHDDPIGAGRRAARRALHAITAAGWRIVVTDPNTEPGERPIVLEEWS